MVDRPPALFVVTAAAQEMAAATEADLDDCLALELARLQEMIDRYQAMLQSVTDIVSDMAELDEDIVQNARESLEEEIEEG
mgnify:CR=1 FL=1